MKILLTGCGAVGLGIAASLFNAGENPDLIARGKTAAAIRENGIERHGLFQDVVVPAEHIHVYESAYNLTDKRYDYVIVCCKATASEQVAEELGNCNGLLAENGRIVIFQNGFDNDAPFRKYFQEEAICAASIITGFERSAPNVSIVTVHSAPAVIGGLYGGDGGTEPLAKAINAGGLPCTTTDNITRALWTKMLYNCTLNPLSAVLGTNYGGLLQSPDGKFMMDKIIEEIFAVMKAAGYSTQWSDAEAYKKDFYGKILPPTAAHRASTLQDMERKIKTEINSLTGVVVRLGEKHGVPVPFNTMLYHLVKAKEALY